MSKNFKLDKDDKQCYRLEVNKRGKKKCYKTKAEWDMHNNAHYVGWDWVEGITWAIFLGTVIGVVVSYMEQLGLFLAGLIILVSCIILSVATLNKRRYWNRIEDNKKVVDPKNGTVEKYANKEE